MNNFTLANMQALQTQVQSGKQVCEVAYDPTQSYAVNPETAATSAGWVQYYREAAAKLVEVIYTK